MKTQLVSKFYPLLKLLGIVFLGWVLVSGGSFLKDWKAILLVLVISAGAVLIEKWRGPYY